MPSVTTTLVDRLAAAKLWLISSPDQSGPTSPRDLAYLGQALYALTPVPTDDVPTMIADERWRVYVNPAWAERVDIPTLGAEVAHLVWHLLMEHADRARVQHVNAATARPWHQACDLTLVDTLAPARACPDSLTGDATATRNAYPRLAAPGRSAEEYYASLSGLPASRADHAPGEPLDPADATRCGSACDGLPRATDLPADANIGTVDEVQADIIRHQVAIDYQEHCKTRGTEPGEALRWARGVTHPVIPWQPLLARAVRFAVGWASGREEPTWSRPSRRQSSSPGFLQPGWRRPVPSIAIVVDTSGSVDDRLLGQAMAEVDGALRALGIPDAGVTVYACDASVGAVMRVRHATDARLVGGGGTDMRVGLLAAGRARPRPDLIVVLTDGYTPWPDTPPPGSAIVVALLRRPGDTPPPTPPWATRIDCVLRS